MTLLRTKDCCTYLFYKSLILENCYVILSGWQQPLDIIPLASSARSTVDSVTQQLVTKLWPIVEVGSDQRWTELRYISSIPPPTHRSSQYSKPQALCSYIPPVFILLVRSLSCPYELCDERAHCLRSFIQLQTSLLATPIVFPAQRKDALNANVCTFPDKYWSYLAQSKVAEAVPLLTCI
jgi:hypothetical protein